MRNRKPQDTFLKTFLNIQQRERIIMNLLIDTLSEGDEDERWIAVKALGDDGGEIAVEILKKVGRQDPSAKVRAVAIHELSFHVDVSGVLAAVKTSLNDESPLVRAKALKAIPKITNNKIVSKEKIDLFSSSGENITGKQEFQLAASGSKGKTQKMGDEQAEIGKFEVDGICYTYFGDEEGRIYIICPENQTATHICFDDELFELRAVDADNIIREIVGYTLADMGDFIFDYTEHPDKHSISFERH